MYIYGQNIHCEPSLPQPPSQPLLRSFSPQFCFAFETHTEKWKGPSQPAKLMLLSQKVKTDRPMQTSQGSHGLLPMATFIYVYTQADVVHLVTAFLCMNFLWSKCRRMYPCMFRIFGVQVAQTSGLHESLNFPSLLIYWPYVTYPPGKRSKSSQLSNLTPSTIIQ